MGLPDKRFSVDSSRLVEQLQERIKDKQMRLKSYSDQEKVPKNLTLPLVFTEWAKLYTVHGKLPLHFPVLKKITKMRGVFMPQQKCFFLSQKGKCII